MTEERDIPALVALAQEAHEESRFSYIRFSPEKVRKIALTALKDTKRHGLFLAEKEEKPVGFAYCSVGEYHIGEGTLIATIHNVNVSRSVRGRLGGGRVALGLFNGIHSWAKARGAAEVLLHVTSGIDLARMHKFAKRNGYRIIGASYANKVT